jgi:hypothetical protein
MAKIDPKPIPQYAVTLINGLHNRRLNALIAANALGGYEDREAEAMKFMKLIVLLYRCGGLFDEDLEAASTLPIDKGERLLKYQAAVRLYGDEFEQLDPETKDAWSKL